MSGKGECCHNGRPQVVVAALEGHPEPALIELTRGSGTLHTGLLSIHRPRTATSLQPVAMPG